MRTILIGILFNLLIIQVYSQVGFTQEGNASVYTEKFEGRTTASGESYNFRKATCSHLNLPFGTIIKVTNLSNNQSVVVRVNDRGPFVPDRIIDISRSAAEKIGIPANGVVKVKIEVVEGPVFNGNKQVTTTTQTSNTQTVTQTTQVDGQTQQTGTELYDIKVSIIQPKGFTIQIGNYKEMVNMLKIASDLKNTLKKEVQVQVTAVNSEKTYRLFVGNFSTRKDAEAFKEKVIKLYPDCFIVELK